MPFEPKKKQRREPGPPDYKQDAALSAIDIVESDLKKVLLGISNCDPEMKSIVNEIVKQIDVARRWVLTN